MASNLGVLEKIELRNYWKNKATDFTPWLAQEENIQLLSNIIGIDLEVQSQEQHVGPFKADILCKDINSDHYVVIENQLEKTDHTHLGQLITYAAGLDALTIIWIAKEFTEQHRAALDWLNKITDDTFNFFGVEIALYKIGNSNPAPMFNLVSKPNNWTKQVKKSTSNQAETATKLLQQEYWQGLKDYMESKKSFLKMRNPLPKHWANIAIGESGFRLSATVNSKDDSINIWLNILNDKSKENYNKLFETAQENSFIEVSQDLIWDRNDSKGSAAVRLKNIGDYSNKKEWDNQFKWFKEYLEKFTMYFKPKIAEITK